MIDNVANNKSQNLREINELITEFCKNILIKNDGLDFNTITDYLTSLSESEIELLNDDSFTNVDSSIIQHNLMEYIQSYQVASDSQQPSSPFDFDSGVNNLSIYRNHFEEAYKTKISQTVPPIFSIIFNDIQDMSDHYRVFEQFYMIRSRETTDSILSRATAKAEMQAYLKAQEGIQLGIKDAIQQATASAELSAKIAEKQAQEAAENAKAASAKAVDSAIKDKMSVVTATISENSVTILGIFAGIVLTIVAGLFYSSSVINNINTSNFYRLISVSALVGFVCINLLAVMFYYVEKIKRKNNTTDKIQNKESNWNCFVSSINIVLILIMILFAILQFKFPNNSINSSPDKATYDVNITTTNNDSYKTDNLNDVPE